MVDSLSGVEKEILVSRLGALRQGLQSGFTPLVWTSLTISTFVQQAEKVRSNGISLQQVALLSLGIAFDLSAFHISTSCDDLQFHVSHSLANHRRERGGRKGGKNIKICAY